MGIEPFLLSSSLIGVLAQRLVRVLNPDSKQPFQAGEYERRLLNVSPDEPAPTLFPPRPGSSGGLPGPTRVFQPHVGGCAPPPPVPRRGSRAGARPPCAP